VHPATKERGASAEASHGLMTWFLLRCDIHFTNLQFSPLAALLDTTATLGCNERNYSSALLRLKVPYDVRNY